MKTIKERAEEYNYIHFGKTNDLFQLLAKVAYTAGAADQIAIDNDKAKNAFNKACGWLSHYSWFNEVADEFIKGLEE